MYGAEERWRRSVGPDHVKNEEALHRVKDEKNIVHTINKGRPTGLVTSFVGTAFYNTLLLER
jgi:hypothetical protein